MNQTISTRPIRFFFDGKIVEVEGSATTRTVLQWLREDAHRTGTKEGCAEGDCGACTVIVGELAADGTMQLQTVNACIRLLPTLDGKALFTVEDVKAADVMHPIQRALVETHASQCGFCTPGIVMSLTASYERHLEANTRPTRQQLADDLAGNLCRCTGYKPILEAGEKMFDAPAVRLDTSAALKALKALPADNFEYRAPNSADASREDSFHAPRSIEALAALRLAKPQARLVAGATDIGLWVNKQLRDLGDQIYLGEVAELRNIETRNDILSIGAGASLEAAWAALTANWPVLKETWLRFASPPIRNAGTMGGNVANGSPIGDSAPVLMALDAVLLLRRGDAQRRIPLGEFYTGYMTNQLQSGEFIQAIEVPLSATADSLRVYKITKRRDSDISAVLGAFRISHSGKTVSDARLVFGGMAATVKRAANAEAALRGKDWTEASVEAAAEALAKDFEPISDMRASAAYRLEVSRNLLRRFWLETRPDNPLSANEISVWAHGSEGGAK
jgi:xanthine dehydrogenase small subunit